MNRILILLVSLFACLVSAGAPVKIYAHKINDINRIPIGTVFFNKTAGVLSVEEAKVEFEDGQYCVGADILGSSKCHCYTYLTYPLHHHLTVTIKPKTGELVALSLVKGLGKGISSSIKSIAPGASIPIEQYTAQDAIKPEEKELVDDRSFIQKYWFYIVPALLLFMSQSS